MQKYMWNSEKTISSEKKEEYPFIIPFVESTETDKTNL